MRCRRSSSRTLPDRRWPLTVTIVPLLRLNTNSPAASHFHVQTASMQCSLQNISIPTYICKTVNTALQTSNKQPRYRKTIEIFFYYVPIIHNVITTYNQLTK